MTVAVEKRDLTVNPGPILNTAWARGMQSQRVSGENAAKKKHQGCRGLWLNQPTSLFPGDRPG